MAAGPHIRVPPAAAGISTGRRLWIAAGVIASALFIWMLTFAETGVDEVRVANPEAPDPLAPLEWAGQTVTDFWVPIFYGVTVAVMALLGWIFYRHWRQTGRAHAGLPIFIAIGVVGLIGDPIFNWAMYCNYHPDLLHWPVNWSLMNVSPTVEPLWIPMGAYQVFFLAPAMGAFALYRKFVENRAQPGSFVRRRPLLGLFAFAAVFGCGMDILMEQWMLNMHIYKYTQIAGPAMTWGHGHLQVYEIIWIGALIGFYAMLLHRNDKGESVTQQIAEARPLGKFGLGQLGTAFVLVTVSLALYGAFWATLRETGQAKNIAGGDYPFKAVKTYDPDGKMRAAGQPAPYFKGTWCLGAGCKDR